MTSFFIKLPISRSCPAGNIKTLSERVKGFLKNARRDPFSRPRERTRLLSQEDVAIIHDAKATAMKPLNCRFYIFTEWLIIMRIDIVDIDVYFLLPGKQSLVTPAMYCTVD